ncbi:alpha/beta fold hydrolase [Undibacterium sp. TJN19]|uniref:alpha/beta fold hydrolase n=1 Tax=Undibacterium sp. TJN19 TaxID=3413055 RepID=UPI003BF2497C
METAYKQGENKFHPDSNELLSLFEAMVEHHYVHNGEVRIHYAVAGEGPLLVLLHGFPDYWLGWWQVMADLCIDHRVLAMDLRGYNLSDQPADVQAYSPSDLVGDVCTVIAHQGAKNATVIGHDWGGFLAWHTAMDAPDFVNRLVVLNMPHPWAIARELATNDQQRVASEYVGLFRKPLSHTQISLSRLGAWVTDPVYKIRHDQAMTASSLEAMLHYYRLNWPIEPYQPRTDTPPAVQVPTLLIHGLADSYALPAGLNDVWQWVDNKVTIQTLPRAGHFMQH